MAARETGIGAVETFMHAGKLLALDLLVKVLEHQGHTWSHVRQEVCVVGQNPTLRIRCPSTHCTLLQYAPVAKSTNFLIVPLLHEQTFPFCILFFCCVLLYILFLQQKYTVCFCTNPFLRPSKECQNS